MFSYQDLRYNKYTMYHKSESGEDNGDRTKDELCPNPDWLTTAHYGEQQLNLWAGLQLRKLILLSLGAT